ncbi:MAG: hypothetical protein WBN20_05630, partial [Eudoraea sp.]|uniref:hypothetical protein n=1 Tax=Eudoraea sp. TaxID=1979955 RepID=UPI003C71E26E
VIILIAGIFFALQADNWNERRQNKIIEISILKSIKTGLEQDLVPLREDDLPLLREVIASSQIIIEQLENNRPYNDSLGYHFLTSHLTTLIIYNKGAISTLKSIGINTITNEKIRDQVINLFDVKLYFLDMVGNVHGSSSIYGINHILNSRFDQANYYDDPMTEKEWDGAMIPLDYEGLKKDNEYLYFVKSYKNLTFYYLQNFFDIENEISQVISNIEEELNTLE